MSKLIRDKVPELAVKKGNTLHTQVLNQEVFNQALTAKLVEEALEVQAAPADKLVEELADCYEVIRAIAAENRIELDEIEQARIKKLHTVGGFTKKMLLLDGNEDTSEVFS